jgi:hypothetical protein
MLLCGPALSAERDRPFIDEAEPQTPESVEDRDTTWKEDSTSLPPWPKDEDLVEFSVDDPSSRFRQFIDGKHIQIGKDGAVRYTLVVESRSGARNVSYEGLRCTPSGALRIYAYGTNGRFVKIDGEWEPIQGRGDDKIHRDLHKLLLCIPRKFEPRPPKGIIRAMRAAVPSEASAGFVTD